MGKPKGVNYRQLPNRKLQFYEKLPQRYQRKEAMEIGIMIGVSRATIDRWLKQITKDYLEQQEYGYYVKVENDKVE